MEKIIIAQLKRILSKGAQGKEKNKPYFWADTCNEFLAIIAKLEADFILGVEPEEDEEEAEEEVSE